MMKCVAIDDEPIALDIIKDYIEKVPFLTIKKSFRDSLKALEYLQNHEVDLIFLDISMPDLSGIQLLKLLQLQPLVIFTTAYSEYAVESYEYQTVDYLLKPIEFDRFLKAANKAFDHWQLVNKNDVAFLSSKENKEKKTDSLLLKSGTNFFHIKISDIFYVQAAGNYVIFKTENKEIMSIFTMSDVLQLLPSQHFFRVHKSYIVNFQHVEVVETEQLLIKDKKIPIGDVFREGFFRAIKI